MILNILYGIAEDGHIVQIRERDVLFFVVKDSMDPNGSRGLYKKASWPRTSIRPKLEWIMKKI